MLIGVPGSGKSTWIKAQNFDMARTLIASTDNQIETLAAAAGKTYNDVFSELIKSATAAMNHQVREAIQVGADIVWDQTNVSVRSRQPKLALIPAGYKKVAVVFPTPDKTELDRRLASRPGKTIPGHVVQSMAANLEMPTVAEGFDEVKVLQNGPAN